MSRLKFDFLLLAVVAGVLLSGVAPAEDQKASRERELLRRAQQALQGAEAEKASLQREKAEIQAQLEAALAENRQLKSGQATRARSLESELRSTQASRAAASNRLADVDRRLEESTRTQATTAAALSARDAEVRRLTDELGRSRAAEAAAEDKNRRLYAYSRELLQQYEHKGVWAALAGHEPVLGLGRVETETLLQEYEDKLRRETVVPAARE